MVLWKIICGIIQQPTFWGILCELCKLMAPLWVAVVVGVIVGWVWKPKWVCLVTEMLDSPVVDGASSSYLSQPAETSPRHQMMKVLPFSIPSFDSFKIQMPGFVSRSPNDEISKEFSLPPASFDSDICRPLNTGNEDSIISDKDFEELYKLYNEKDGGPAWIQMMNRSTDSMSYQAWRRDQSAGPPQYRSRTVFEDATPEMVKDFFWDDEFRGKWDDMLIHSETLESSPTNGTFVVKWVRKFPFFCSDREYIIGRRIWESGCSYFCVTKSVPNSVPRHDKPRRVDLYYSSWCIQAGAVHEFLSFFLPRTLNVRFLNGAVESRRGDKQLSACEVMLFHYEDMGIPWEIAKHGVRQGMWGAVKKIDPGLRAYQRFRAAGAPLSQCATLAQITTKVTKQHIRSIDSGGEEVREGDDSKALAKPPKNNIPRLLVIGGAVALAFTIDRGLPTKAVIFGVARRFGNVGKRLP